MFAARVSLLVVSGLIATGSFVAAAAPSRGSHSAGSGWDGTLNYIAVQPPEFPRISGVRLRVTHAGAVVYNRAVPLPSACASLGCRLAPVRPGQPFALVQLDSGTNPVALIWLSTRGVSCCTLVQTVAIPSGRLATKSFGHAPARLDVVAGERVFVSGDDRFSSAFSVLADAGRPVRIWRYRAGVFVEATGRFPSTVAADAARWWQATQRATRAKRDARGVFAAWAADTCRLGKNRTLTRELRAALAAGAFSPARVESGPTGVTYAAVLRARLRAWGYCR